MQRLLTLDELLVLLGALLLRALMGPHPHSGEGLGPRYGDYEAQRHWQEVRRERRKFNFGILYLFSFAR